MNLHPGKMELPAAAPRRTENRSARRSCYGPFLFKIMLIFLGFMSVLVIHLYLRQQSVKAAERTEDLDKQIKKVEAEILKDRLARIGLLACLALADALFKRRRENAVSLNAQAADCCLDLTDIDFLHG